MRFVKDSITAVILAGGRARRMEGVDKGLIPLCGRPMIAHIVDAMREQADKIVINANRNIDTYRSMGCLVVPDREDNFAGPLAGMSSGLHAADTLLCLTVPCDSPLMGPDIAPRLHQALHEAEADIAVAHDGDRTHPVVTLMRTALASSIDDFLNAGERKIDLWFERHRWVTADCSDHPEYFFNVNTEEERRQVEQRICPGEK